MTVAQCLAKVKEAMRIKHNQLDNTLTDDINAAALDLQRAGVVVYQVNDNVTTLVDDQLVQTAIRLYVFACEDYNDKGEQYRQGYQSLLSALALSGSYRDAE
jgi:hypothetical protein